MKKNTSTHLLAITSVVFLLIVFGTWFIYSHEGWSLVDSFYFIVMTLTTVGYGDLTPTTDTSKIMIALYSMISLPIVLFALSVVAKSYFEERLFKIEKRIGEVLNREKDLEEKIEGIEDVKPKRGFWGWLFRGR